MALYGLLFFVLGVIAFFGAMYYRDYKYSQRAARLKKKLYERSEENKRVSK